MSSPKHSGMPITRVEKFEHFAFKRELVELAFYVLFLILEMTCYYLTSWETRAQRHLVVCCLAMNLSHQNRFVSTR